MLRGGKTTTRYDTDREILFRQESNFQYLFGVEEPDCWGVIIPIIGSWGGGIDLVSEKVSLFVPRLSPEHAVWLGEIHTLDYFRTKYGVDSVDYVDNMHNVLQQFSTILMLEEYPELSGLNVDTEQLRPELEECRVIKTEEELQLMRYINKISSLAHLEVMKRCHPGMKEYELEALFLYLTYKNGRCRHQSYTCICAGGCNSAILHYPHNDKEITDGNLVLLDMGAEYHGYCSDITNTFPANGKFTPDQRAIYEIVYLASREVMSVMKPGVPWEEMHLLAERIIGEGLQELDLIRGSIDELIEHNIPAIFFPHGLGHLLGLSIHMMSEGILPE